MQDLQRHEVQELIEKGAQVVEVLPRDEYDEDHVPGAIHIPLGNVEREAGSRLDKGLPVVLYCWDSA